MKNISPSNNSPQRTLERNDMLAEFLYSGCVPDTELQELVRLADGDGARLRRLAVRKRFGEPNAYLRGYVTMMNRRFQVDRRCYIPDNYAEALVERVISETALNSSLLEIGTGCGWIAITLKLERPDLTVFAADIDPNALRVARENAGRYGAKIGFFESFYADDIPIAEPDYIVANIPYGGDAEYTDLELEQRPQMPPISICDPDDVVKPLIDFVSSVNSRGWQSKIYLETGYLDKDCLEPLFQCCRSWKHVQKGEFAYLVLE